jgi:hypothetical protein
MEESKAMEEIRSVRNNIEKERESEMDKLGLKGKARFEYSAKKTREEAEKFLSRFNDLKFTIAK